VLAFYFARIRLNSLYGSASTVIALLLWCYYAAQIVFLGAEFTRVHIVSEGGRIPLKDVTERLQPGTGKSTGRNNGLTPSGRRRPVMVK